MKKILFISYDGMTDPLGQSQVIPYLSGLTRFGYKFTILSCDKPEKYTEFKDMVHKKIESSGIDWVSIPYHKYPSVLSSVYDYIALRRKAIELHSKNNYDMVHTRPGIPTLVAMSMKKKYGLKFFNDIRGFWADERVDGHMWNLKNPVYKAVYKFFKRHESECLDKADINTCLTYAARKEIQSWKRNIPEIRVIPCSVDLELFDPAHINENLKENFRTRLGIRKEDRIFSYLGSIGGWYLTNEMMRFFKMVSNSIPDAKFLFISPHRHDIISAAASREGLAEDKIITFHASREEVPVLLSFSEYSLFFIKPCYSKISSSPTKHGEIMAMGIPVITNSGIGDVDSILEKYNAGYLVSDFSDMQFKEVIDRMVRGDAHFDRNMIRKGAREFYDLENALLQYRKAYAAVLD